jgi:hypothetical protein
MAITFSKTWPGQLPERFKFHNNPRSYMQTQKVMLHNFTVGDVEDPMLYASFTIQEWQQTEKGQWCTEHCEGEIYFQSWADPISLGYKIVLEGEMSEQNYTFFNLKWSQ